MAQKQSVVYRNIHEHPSDLHHYLLSVTDFSLSSTSAGQVLLRMPSLQIFLSLRQACTSLGKLPQQSVATPTFCAKTMQKPRRQWEIAALNLLLPLHILLWPLFACSSSSLPSVILHSSQGNAIHVSVEIVATPEKRNFGLMYRKELPESHGMLFLFPREQALSFWMKNTPLPLDIIFMNSSHTIVNIIANTEPFSEKPLPSGPPAQFVLEVNAGFCQRHGIKVGSQVELPNALSPII